MSTNGTSHSLRAAFAPGAPVFVLVFLFALALALRLMVWNWHEFYPLGGDEQEYFNQALILLREHQYVELRLMRPPLYTVFLSAMIYLFDSLVQRLRLIQALIGALAIIPAYGMATTLFGNRRVGLVAALLVAINYTLAAATTELLTETLFMAGLLLFFWLILAGGAAPAGHSAARRTLVAGLSLGALALLRSVALPLLPLGALWLLMRRPPTSRWMPAIMLILGATLVIAPWTIRNYATYGALILIDTTGAENLWLDNDPDGREFVKQQLYALGDDRALRQRLAAERGTRVILDDPARFLDKAWGEAQKFFALQYFDDLRARRAIWVPPAEVWLRVLAGDGLWLLLLIGGTIGWWLGSEANHRTDGARLFGFASPRWLFLPWAFYTLLTALAFHVELRYRLPLYPALLPYAAWLIVGPRTPRHWLKLVGAALSCLALIGITLLHRPYLNETWMLARKHTMLWQADQALEQGRVNNALAAAQSALQLDPESALARVALARAKLLDGDQAGAQANLAAARATLNAHPYAHLLEGALLRRQGALARARVELAYETGSLEDLQNWAWNVFAPIAPPQSALDIGGGLDLGYVRGFYAAEPGGFRWSRAESQIRLASPASAGILHLRMASGRPATAIPPQVAVLIDGAEVGVLQISPQWQTYRLPAPARPAGSVIITLRSNTFNPRDFDPASPDNRNPGIMVDMIELKVGD